MNCLVMYHFFHWYLGVRLPFTEVFIYLKLFQNICPKNCKKKCYKIENAVNLFTLCVVWFQKFCETLFCLLPEFYSYAVEHRSEELNVILIVIQGKTSVWTKETICQWKSVYSDPTHFTDWIMDWCRWNNCSYVMVKGTKFSFRIKQVQQVKTD